MVLANSPSPTPAAPSETADSGRVAFGGGYRLPALTNEAADSGRIAFGGGYRLAAAGGN